MPAVVAPLLWPFTCVGAAWSLARPVRRFFTDHFDRVQMLIALIPLMILGGHSLLYWLGRMASNGELRYMLVVAPFWGLLSAKGFEWCAQRFNVTRVYRFAAVAALATIGANLYYPVLPLHLTVDGARAKATAEWYRSTELRKDYPRLLASNPEIAYFLGVSHTDPSRMRDWRKDVAAAAPAGTLLVWDPVYALFNADNNRVVTIEEIERAGWVERPELAEPINEIGDGSNDWRIFVSPSPIKAAPPASMPRSE
jgi:hypothetical protein